LVTMPQIHCLNWWSHVTNT